MAEQRNSVARFFGYAMIAVGVLMTLLSGGCTIVVFLIGWSDKSSHDLVWISLMSGLPFVAIGVGLFLGGRSLTRGGKTKTPPGDVF